MVRSTSKLERVAQPRTGYHYSNVMYVVAGEVIEVISGSSWEDFLAARIFGPLGMTSTVTTHEPLDTISNVAVNTG
jgi:CubicO group peptidase (beta-lactamase class C family)